MILTISASIFMHFPVKKISQLLLELCIIQYEFSLRISYCLMMALQRKITHVALNYVTGGSIILLWLVCHPRCVFINYNWINQLTNTTIWWLDKCCLLHRYQLYVSALMAIFRLIDWQQTCKQLYFGLRLVYGGGGLGLDGVTRSRVCWVGRVMWVHGYYCAGLSLYSLPLWYWIPYTRRIPKYSYLQVCCQSLNLKMAIRAETCSWYLCNKQHISNHQIVVFDSWLIQL